MLDFTTVVVFTSILLFYFQCI